MFDQRPRKELVLSEHDTCKKVYKSPISHLIAT